MNILRLLNSKYLGIPKIVRKLVLFPLKKDPLLYARANRLLSGYELRLNFFVEDASKAILRSASGKTAPCFVDCGFNDGAVLKKFVEALPGFTFEGYEIQRELFEAVSASMPRAKLYNAAVFTRNDKIQIFLSKRFSYHVRGGSTVIPDLLMPDNVEGSSIVDCIDFLQYLLYLRKRHNFIAIKMDIEGAEYDVLEHVLKCDQTIIDLLIIEFHPRSVDQARHDRVEALLKERSIVVIEWQ